MYLNKPLSDFPTKYSWIVLLVFFNLVFNFRCSNTWFAAPDYSGSNTSGLLVPNYRQKLEPFVLQIDTLAVISFNSD